MADAAKERKLRSEICRILKEASELDVDREGADACLLAAVRARSSRPNPGPSGRTARRSLSVRRVIAYVTAVFCLSFLCAVIAVFNSPELGERVGKLLQPYQYEILGFARIPALLTAVKLLGLSRYYGDECIISNPLYVEKVSDCWPCQHLESIPDFTGESVSFMQTHLGLLFTLKAQANVSDGFTALKNMVLLHGHLIDNDQDKLWSTSRKIARILDFQGEVTREDVEMADEGSFHMSWTSRTVSSSRAVRLSFPRPPFLPTEVEVALEKTLLLDGPCAQAVKLPLGHFSYNWYHQLSGTRKLTFWPNSYCSTVCKPLSVIVDSGTVVHYQDQLWNLETSGMTENCGSDSVSLAYIGSFIY